MAFFSGNVAKLHFQNSNSHWQVMDIEYFESNKDENIMTNFNLNLGTLDPRRLAFVPIEGIFDFDLDNTKWVKRTFDQYSSQEIWQANNDFTL